MAPISMFGDKLLWKKAQKKDKKKNTSEIINKIIPQRKPFDTRIVCLPWNVPSRQTSRHHWYIVIKVTIYPNKRRFMLKLWNHLIIPVTNVSVPIAPVNGQGL